MDLYRIILVDDEEEVRTSIIKKIDWESAGFCVVGDAENGEDAMEKIEMLEPDVILTDIRMPYMDGLTLAERVRQKYPSMKIIIFSGFDDFEYAKQAIKLNVIEYILKPVNVEELTAILKRIKSNLDQEIEQKRNVNLLRENYRKSLPILREQFLNNLVGIHMEESIVTERMEAYDIPLLGAKKWIAAAIDIEPARVGRSGNLLPLHQEADLIPISVMQILEEHLERYCRFSLFNAPRTSEAELVLILAVDESNTQTRLIDVLGDICKEVNKILEVPITVGIGHHCTKLGEISSSFKDAVNALGYKSIVGIGSTIYINDVEPMSRGKLQLESKDEAELTAAIKFGPRERIETIIRVLMDKMSDAKVHYRQRQAYMLSISNCIIQVVQMYDLDMEEMFESGIEEHNLISFFHQTQKAEEYGQWLEQVALRINACLGQERDNTIRQVIQEAKQYILNNYHDPDLSVEQVCRHLHMSPAYFSTMFRKETGQTYIAYLTEVRLDKAVELLNKTEDKTYVIASKVGYQEQNYFSYVFKKRFGVSPTKFRGAK